MTKPVIIAIISAPCGVKDIPRNKKTLDEVDALLYQMHRVTISDDEPAKMELD